MSLLAEKLTPCHAFLTLLFVSVVASAQTSPAIRSEVKEVLVPAVVTDGHGHHVLNLKVSDFQVLEDGKPQRIVALSTESSAGIAGSFSIDQAAGARAAGVRGQAREPEGLLAAWKLRRSGGRG